MAKENTNYGEGFYACIRYAWEEIRAPKDEVSSSRITGLISTARKAYAKLKDNQTTTMLQDLNELEKKLEMGITK